MKARIHAMIDVPMKPEGLYDRIVDSRTCREVSAEVWHAVWNILDDCYDLDGDTVGRIAQTVSDLTELALQRKNQREVSR